ncbi:MAG: aspartate/glutamate racemase family protein [Bacillota bacterium]
MKEIIFYDSGIGGISLLNKTRAICKKEHFVYCADNANMPYGTRGEKEVSKLVISNLEKQIKTTTKAVVIACNTITNLAIKDIRNAFPETKIFGIEPEIKGVSNGKMGSALLIATPKTCEVVRNKISPQTAEKITIHPAYNLAKIIEREIANKEEIYREITKIKRSHPKKFQAVILGCTHYALCKDVFTYAFSENVKILDGINGTARNVARNIVKEKTGFGSLRLVLSKDDMCEKLKYASLIN